MSEPGGQPPRSHGLEGLRPPVESLRARPGQNIYGPARDRTTEPDDSKGPGRSKDPDAGPIGRLRHRSERRRMRREEDRQQRTDGGGERRSVPEKAPTKAPGSRLRWWLALAVLTVALLGGGALRVALIHDKHEFHNDEAYSYIEATGHLSDYRAAATGGLNGHWVTAGRWQALWLPDQTWGLRAIARDMAQYDITPPLYFWLLHFWLLAVGTHLWSGPVLNLIVSALAGLALFGFARRLLKNNLDAALVVLTWSLSRVVVATSSLARHYDLLSLLVIVFAWLVVACNDARRPARPYGYVGLALVTGAAFLTHYQFLLAVVAGAVYAFALAWWNRGDGAHPWLRMVGTVVALAGGLGAAVLVDPGMFHSFRGAEGIDYVITVDTFFDKIDAVVDTVARFYGLGTAWFDTLVSGKVPPPWAPWLRPSAVLLLAGVVLVIVIVDRPTLRRLVGRRMGPPGANGLPAIFFGFWLAGGVIIQNLAYMTQPQLMSGRYLSLAWPFLAFVPLLVFRVLGGRLAVPLTVAFCLGVLLPTALLGPIRYDSKRPSPLPALRSADRMVITSTGPGQLLNSLWDVPSTASVYADAPEKLVFASGAWLPPLATGDAFVYFVSGTPGPSRDRVTQLTQRSLQRLEEGRRVRLLPRSDDSRGVYRVEGPR